MSKRSLSAREQELWATTMHDVQLLPHEYYQEPLRLKAPRLISDPLQTLVAPKKAPPQQAGLSRKALRQVSVEATLDLHGMTVEQARLATLRWVRSHYAHGIRQVLLITGKGKPTGTGLLYQAFFQWLQESDFSAYVSGYQQAQPHHGGQGAFYLMIRAMR